MTVSEFIEWLKTQDQGATVEVIEMRLGRYGPDVPCIVAFDPDMHADYIDLRDNQFATNSDARTLTLGEV